MDPKWGARRHTRMPSMSKSNSLPFSRNTKTAIQTRRGSAHRSRYAQHGIGCCSCQLDLRFGGMLLWTELQRDTWLVWLKRLSVRRKKSAVIFPTFCMQDDVAKT